MEISNNSIDTNASWLKVSAKDTMLRKDWRYQPSHERTYHLENKHKPSSTPHRGACGCLPKWHLKRAMIRLEKPERNRVISRLMHIRKAVKRMKCLEAIL